MNVTVKHNGTDVTNYVISYEREAKICTGIGTLQITLTKTFPRSLTTWDEFIIIEEGREIGYYYVSVIENKENDSTISLSCQDNSKRLTDYFISDNYIVDYPSYTGYWIEKFLTDANCPHDTVGSSAGVLLSNNTGLGLTSAYEQIVQLLQMSGWYLSFTGTKAGVGRFTGEVSSVKGKFNRSDIIDIKKIKHDKMLRNRAVVWGASDPLASGWVFADLRRHTPWNYGPNDYRTVVMSNSGIKTVDQANNFATKLLNAFAKITEEKHITLHGARDIQLGDGVKIKSGVWSGTGVVTTLGSSMSSDGLFTKIILDERCPRLFNFFDWGDYVYASTYGAGVYRKHLDFDHTWYPFASGLNNLEIMDLYKNQNLITCIDSSGILNTTYDYNSLWNPVNISGLMYVENDAYKNPIASGKYNAKIQARAVIHDKTDNSIRAGVDTYKRGNGPNYGNRYVMTSGVLIEGGVASGISLLDPNLANPSGTVGWVVDIDPDLYTVRNSYQIISSGITNIKVLDIENDGRNDFVSVAVEQGNRVMGTSGYELGYGPVLEVNSSIQTAIPAGIDKITSIDTAYTSDTHTRTDRHDGIYISESSSYGKETSLVDFYCNNLKIFRSKVEFGQLYVNEYRIDITGIGGTPAPLYLKKVSNLEYKLVVMYQINPGLGINYYQYKKVTISITNLDFGICSISTDWSYNYYPLGSPSGGFPSKITAVTDTAVYIDDFYENAGAPFDIAFKSSSINMLTGSYSLLESITDSPADYLYTTFSLADYQRPEPSININLLYFLVDYTYNPSGPDSWHFLGKLFHGPRGTAVTDTILDITIYSDAYNSGTIFSETVDVKPRRINHNNFAGISKIRIGENWYIFEIRNSDYTFTSNGTTEPSITHNANNVINLLDLGECPYGVSLEYPMDSPLGNLWFFDPTTLLKTKDIVLSGYTNKVLFTAPDTLNNLLYMGVTENATGYHYLVGVNTNSDIVTRFPFSTLYHNPGIISVWGEGTNSAGWFVYYRTGIVTAFAYSNMLPLPGNTVYKILKREGSAFTEVQTSTSPDRLDVSNLFPMIAVQSGINSTIFVENYPTRTYNTGSSLFSQSQDYVGDFRYANIQGLSSGIADQTYVYTTPSGINAASFAPPSGATIIPGVVDDHIAVSQISQIYTASGLTQIETSNEKFPYQYILVAASGLTNTVYQSNPDMISFFNVSTGLPSGYEITRIRIDDVI